MSQLTGGAEWCFGLLGLESLLDVGTLVLEGLQKVLPTYKLRLSGINIYSKTVFDLAWYHCLKYFRFRVDIVCFRRTSVLKDHKEIHLHSIIF